MSLGTDYAQQTLAVNALDDHTISEGMRIVCYNQTIYDDVVAEGQEYVGLSLHVSQASVLTQVQPVYDQAAILILDNDGNLYTIVFVSYSIVLHSISIPRIRETVTYA